MDHTGNIRLGCRVEEARWERYNYNRQTVVARNGGKGAADGKPYTMLWDYLASALGQSDVPRYPKLPGVDTFNGSSCIRHAGK